MPNEAISNRFFKNYEYFVLFGTQNHQLQSCATRLPNKPEINPPIFQCPQCCWWFNSLQFPFFFLHVTREVLGGHILNNGIVIHHLIMIWQMLAPSPSSASSSLSILRSAKLSRTPPVGLIRAVCLCEAAGALGAAGARHCQWTERLTLPGSRTQTHDPRFPCYCFHLNPPPSFSCSCLFPFLRVCLLLLLSPLSLSASVSLSLSTSWFLSVAPLFPSFLPPTLKPGRERRTAAASGRNITQRNRERLWEHSRKKKQQT